MNAHDVFVAAECPASMVRAAIEAALGATFSFGDGPEPVPALVTGTTMVFLHDSHPFEGDADFPVTRFAYRVNVRDSARDTERQLAIAGGYSIPPPPKAGRRCSYGTQGNITLYP